MNPIVFAIVVVVVLGLAGGVILVLASKFMAVYEDPRIAQVTVQAVQPVHFLRSTTATPLMTWMASNLHARVQSPRPRQP